MEIEKCVYTAIPSNVEHHSFIDIVKPGSAIMIRKGPVPDVLVDEVIHDMKEKEKDRHRKIIAEMKKLMEEKKEG